MYRSSFIGELGQWTFFHGHLVLSYSFFLTRSFLLVLSYSFFISAAHSHEDELSDEGKKDLGPVVEASTSVVDLSSLPQWLEYRGDHESPVVEIGDYFAGDRPEGIIRVVNSGQEPLSIADIKTSCGCMVARTLDPQIKPGESSIIIAKINASKIGPIDVTVYFTLGGVKRRVSLNGTTKRRISYEDNLEFETDGTAKLRLLVHDKRLDPSQIKFQISAESPISIVKRQVEGTVVTLDLKRKKTRALPSTFAFVPLQGKFAYPQIRVALTHRGQVQVVPNVVHGVVGTSKLRAFLRGDMELLGSDRSETNSEIVIRAEDSQDSVKFVGTIMIHAATHSAVAKIEAAELASLPRGRYFLDLTCNDVSFGFQLQLR